MKLLATPTKRPGGISLSLRSGDAGALLSLASADQQHNADERVRSSACAVGPWQGPSRRSAVFLGREAVISVAGLVRLLTLQKVVHCWSLPVWRERSLICSSRGATLLTLPSRRSAVMVESSRISRRTG